MERTWRPYRLEIRGTLKMDVFRIGAGQKLDLRTDAPILREPDGRPYIPGSSIRGVLRHYLECERELLGCDEVSFKKLFGVTPRKGENGVLAWLGRLTVEDAVCRSGAAGSEIRDHVKIDRRSGSAARGPKFDAETADARSAGYDFRAFYEGDRPDEGAIDPALVLLWEALRALAAGEISLGARSGCGFGRMKLEGAEYRAFERNDDAGLARWLGTRLPNAAKPEDEGWRGIPTNPDGQPLEAKAAWCVLDLNLRLLFEGPFLVHAPLPPPPCPEDKLPGNFRDPATYACRGEAVADSIFVRRWTDPVYAGREPGGLAHVYLPGSSLRGVLRSHAERICRTVLDSTSVSDRLFGPMLGEKRTEKGGKPAKEAKWKGRIEVADGKLEGESKTVYLDHVAIDRITAAASDGAKFSTSALASPEFTTTIRVRFRQDELQVAALWGRVLRDLMRGALWVGAGVTRGYGYLRKAEVSSARLSVPVAFAEKHGISIPRATTESRPGRIVMTLEPMGRFEDLAPLWKAADDAGWSPGKEVA